MRGLKLELLTLMETAQPQYVDFVDKGKNEQRNRS